MVNIKLKLARIEKGFSQAALAKAAKVSRQTIGLIEKGVYNPTIKLCLAICDVLNKTLNDLFFEKSNAFV